MHGPHHTAQKSNTHTDLGSSARAIFLPSKVFNVNSGDGLPIHLSEIRAAAAVASFRGSPVDTDATMATAAMKVTNIITLFFLRKPLIKITPDFLMSDTALSQNDLLGERNVAGDVPHFVYVGSGIDLLNIVIKVCCIICKAVMVVFLVDHAHLLQNPEFKPEHL